MMMMMMMMLEAITVITCRPTAMKTTAHCGQVLAAIDLQIYRCAVYTILQYRLYRSANYWL